MLQKALIKLIDFYRNYLVPLKLPSCRYYPTCSEYSRQAIKKYGAWRGILKGSYRILRCNPFSKGGYDPVKEVDSNH